MNNYSKFVNFEPEKYDRLKVRGVKDYPIYAQVNKYLDYCANTRQMSRMTMHGKEGALRYLIGESGCRDLKDLTNEKYDLFVRTELIRGVSPKTINGRTAHILAMVRYYKELGLDIPLRLPLVFKLKESPPRRISYTREQVNYVLECCNSDMEWLLIKIAFDTGMRISEIRNLSVEQLCGRRVKFIGKGRKEREVWLGDECATRLYGYIVRKGIKTGKIWLNRWGYPVSADTIRRVMRRAFLRCGFEDFYPHSLRHSFGTDIQRHGANIFEIKEMMGHANINTTQRYLHTFDGQLESLFAKYKN